MPSMFGDRLGAAVEAAVVRFSVPAGWTALERRWCEALLSALVPGDGRLPALSELDLDAFWARYGAAAPPMLRFGLRASVDLLALSPPLLLGRARTVAGLSPEEREELLERALSSPVFLIRQLATTVKLIGLMAYLRDPVARARVGSAS